MKRAKRSVASVVWGISCAAITLPASAQPVASGPETAAPIVLAYAPYLTDVAKTNLDLVAQRANLTVAEAQIEIAKVFPDPSLAPGVLQYDVTRQGNPTEATLTLNVPLQIGGQRGARIAFARAGASAAQADLAEFVRNLRGDAANAFVDAVHARDVLGRKRLTLESLERLVTVNQERVRAGDIGEVLLVQSRVEAEQFHAEVLEAEGEVRTSDLALLAFLGERGKALAQRTIDVQGELRVDERQYDLEALLATSRAQRPDLLGALRRVDAAQRQTTLTRANRIPDIAVSVFWQHNFEVNSATPVPAADLLGGALTVPLPFSRIYRGDLDAAYAGESQAVALQKSTEVHVELEVREALSKYEAAAARARLYSSGVLKDADSVLEKTLYNYQRGGATLVEVLVAQHTVNDVYLSYYDALADVAHARVALQQAAASWDDRL
jgi:outer membrane protein, heavy metal efflux system